MTDKGRSYFLWTLFTYVPALVCMIVYSAGSHHAGRWMGIFFAPFVLLANIIGFAIFALRHWLSDYHPFFPHELFFVPKLHGKSLPWQLPRIADIAIAFLGAWAFMFLALWMWDTHRFYEIHVESAKENVWVAGAVALRTAVMISVTEGGLPFEPKEVITTLLFAMDAALSIAILVLVISVVIAHAAESHRGGKTGHESERPKVAEAKDELDF
jgi:hypothetical protein